jgi:hypothetical protein
MTCCSCGFVMSRAGRGPSLRPVMTGWGDSQCVNTAIICRRQQVAERGTQPLDKRNPFWYSLNVAP